MAINDDSATRTLNAAIAADYDVVPYDPPIITGIDPENIFTAVTQCGITPRTKDFDVLDLGCGTGVQMERLAGMTAGRVVGIDLSQTATARAAERCARFGERCDVRCADFLDLTPEGLQQFDLIYCVGVLYVTPPTVQSHLLRLIAACLKPNGLAVISYYNGTAPLLLLGLRQTLRGLMDETAPRDVQIRQARAHIQTMAELFQRHDPRSPMVGLLQQTSGRSDAVLYHEMLGGTFEVMATSALEGVLGKQGVHFLNWMVPGPFGHIADPRDRALTADAFDFAGGGYHYAVFSKFGGVTGR